jgi:beta-galactosidase
MDGSVTSRAEMAGRVARWANDHPNLWKSAPLRGDLGLVFVPESEIFNYMQQGDTAFYSESIRGAYQAFFDSNIQADFVAVDNIGEYKMIYLPYPVMLKEETVVKLREYVEKGGTLISEGLPAYFGDHGHVGTVQPNYGLDKVFGACQSYVEFLPDVSEDLTLTIKDRQVNGRYFRQEYELSGGAAAGQYTNGKTAAVEHKFGQGRTLLMGSFPGSGYYLNHSTTAKALFASFLEIAGVEQQLKTDDSNVQARLHKGPGGTYLWVTNPTLVERPVRVSFRSSAESFKSGEDQWGKQRATLSGQNLAVVVPARDAVVLVLQ